jgi:hypothetical protein
MKIQAAIPKLLLYAFQQRCLTDDIITSNDNYVIPHTASRVMAYGGESSSHLTTLSIHLAGITDE